MLKKKCPVFKYVWLFSWNDTQLQGIYSEVIVLQHTCLVDTRIIRFRTSIVSNAKLPSEDNDFYFILGVCPLQQTVKVYQQ